MNDLAAARPREPRNKRDGALLGLLLLGGIALMAHGLLGYDASLGFEPSVSDTENLLFSPTGSSSALNLYIMAWLYYSRRRVIWRALGQPGLVSLGAPLLAIGFGLAYWSYYVSAPDLLVPALMCALFGAAAALGGWACVRAVGLPVFFLVFLFARPGVIVNEVVYPLQMFAARSSLWILDALGHDTVRLGDLLVTEDGIFQVVEGCSGMRLIETLFMASLLYVDLFRRNTLQVVLLVALSPLIALTCNTLRVITIVLSPYSDLAAVHSTQGILVLVAGVLTLAGIDSLMREFLEPRLPASLLAHGRAGPGVKRVAPLPIRRLAILAGVSLSLALGTFAIEPYRVPAERFPLVSNLPAEVEGWRITQGLRFDEKFMGSVGASEWVRRRYERDGEAVEIFIASNDRRRRHESLRSPKTILLDSGVSLGASQRVVGTFDGRVLDRLFLSRGREAWQALFWRGGEARFIEDSARALLALDQSPFRRTDRELVVRIATEQALDPARAARTLDAFLRDFDAELEALEIPIGYAADRLARRAGAVDS